VVQQHAARIEPDPLERLRGPIVFVVGVARSGTSWVQAILRAHPEVNGAYETGLFELDGPIASLLDPARWTPGAKGLEMLMTRDAMVAEVRHLTSRLLARRLGPDDHHLVEKTPTHLFSIPLISEVFPEARFIHVVRDGRDVYVSVRQASRSWAPDWRKRRLQMTAAGQARLWKKSLGVVDRAAPALAERYMEIRYDEIKQHPFDSYRRIFDHARIPYTDAILEEIHRKTDFELNYTPNEAEFRRGGRVGDWHTHMNLAEGLMYNAVAGDELVRRGYERSRRWTAPVRRKVPPTRQNRE